MAMIECKECKTPISNKAKTCPKCGAKVPQKTGLLTKLVAVVIGIGVIGAIVGQSNAPPAPVLTQAQIDQKQKDEIQFQRVVRVLKALKATAKNPKSFELNDALLMDDGTLCATYSATNSFNAVVPDQKAILSDGSFGSWSKYCAGKVGKNYKYARLTL